MAEHIGPKLSRAKDEIVTKALLFAAEDRATTLLRCLWLAKRTDLSRRLIKSQEEYMAFAARAAAEMVDFLACGNMNTVPHVERVIHAAIILRAEYAVHRDVALQMLTVRMDDIKARGDESSSAVAGYEVTK